jgi:hypothetical protein
VVKAMLLSKLICWAVAVAVVVVSAGAGLTYRAVAQETQQARAEAVAAAARPAPRPAPDDLEALRKEVRALRVRVQALEAEVQALRPRGGAPGGRMGSNGEAPADLVRRSARQAPGGAPDPLAGAEAAVKRLRQNPNDKEAVAAVQQALRNKTVEDLVTEIENALAYLRDRPDDRQAAGKLQEALNRLAQRLPPPQPPQNLPGSPEQ